MAFSAAASSGYAPGSIAARPVRQIGGRKRPDSAPGFSAAAQAPTRADNIAASRADGTFDAKRNAFNAANKGSFMDASGNIGPKAEMPTTPAPSPAAPPPAPAPAPAPTTTAPAPMKPRGPATFDGKSKADFFGAGMAKYGPSADMPGIYNDAQVKGVAANGGKPVGMAEAAKAPRTGDNWKRGKSNEEYAREHNQKQVFKALNIDPQLKKAAADIQLKKTAAAKPYTGPMARPTGFTAAATMK